MYAHRYFWFKQKIEENLHRKVDIMRQHKDIKPLFLEMLVI
jgi:hypothetical protein